MCRFNMEKNHFVLNQMDKIPRLADARAGPHNLSRASASSPGGAGQATRRKSPVLGMVVAVEFAGVHTLWLPIISDAGRPGVKRAQEPWTPTRPRRSCRPHPQAGIAIYPAWARWRGVLAHCPRS